MSVNQSYALDAEKTQRRFGKLFHTIDFEVEPTSKRLLEQRKGDMTIGSLHLGTNQYRLTIDEVDRIIETCMTAKTIYLQKLRLNQ